MSWLAMLCSIHLHYTDMIKGLSALYIAHGYPSNLIVNWTQNNIAAHWQNHLSDNRCEHKDLLVLKSEFNTAWNYFSTRELGDTVLGYRHSWLAAVESNRYSAWCLMFTSDSGNLEDTDLMHCVTVGTPMGPCPILDIQTIGFANCRMIVLQNRMQNLFFGKRSCQ